MVRRIHESPDDRRYAEAMRTGAKTEWKAHGRKFSRTVCRLGCNILEERRESWGRL